MNLKVQYVLVVYEFMSELFENKVNINNENYRKQQDVQA